MEAVAAASSIAGIVSLAGQALSGIVKLRAFFQNCTSASKTIERLLRDLNSLIQTLEDVREIVLKLDETAAVTFDTKSILSSLQIQLEDCTKDVYDWVKKAEEQHPEFGSGRGGLQGSKRRFKEFFVAVNKESLTDIFREIGNHKENITLKLSVIGRYVGLDSSLLYMGSYLTLFRSLDIEQASRQKSMTSKLNDIAVATNTSNQITSDALQRLEAQLAAGRDDFLDSPDLRSLASSMVSSMSRIENLLLAQSPGGGAGSGASSAGLSSAGSGLPQGQKSSDASIGPISPPGSPFGGSRPSSGGNPRHSRAGLQPPSPGLRPLRVSGLEHAHGSGPEALHSKIGELHHVRCFHQTHQTEEAETYPLFESYCKLLDRANEVLPDCLVRYINLVNYSRTINLHAKLIISTQGIIQGLQWDYQGKGSSIYTKESQILPSKQDTKARQEYQDVCHQLEILEQDIGVLRKECWDKGYNLSEIDMILGTKSPAEHSITERSTSAIDENFKALRQRLVHLQSQTALTSKLDRINAWLLQNLAASSDAAALHRTFLPHGGNGLDEKAWARQVLKFWPLDDAAAKVKRRDGKERLSSSIGGVKDGRVAHSARVLLELVEWANSVTTVSEVGDWNGNALRGLFEVERPRSPLGEYSLKD